MGQGSGKRCSHEIHFASGKERDLEIAATMGRRSPKTRPQIFQPSVGPVRFLALSADFATPRERRAGRGELPPPCTFPLSEHRVQRDRVQSGWGQHYPKPDEVATDVRRPVVAASAADEPPTIAEHATTHHPALSSR